MAGDLLKSLIGIQMVIDGKVENDGKGVLEGINTNTKTMQRKSAKNDWILLPILRWRPFSKEDF